MKTHQWIGIILMLLALLPAIGLTFGVLPSFTGFILIFVATLGGFLFVSGQMTFSHGSRLWAGVVLFLLALLPSLGIILSSALVFTGPILVLVAIAGGYLLAAPRGR